MSNIPPKQPTAQPPARAGGKPPHGAAHHDEDELHVPKGVSRGTFLFLVGLIIFLMIIWLVPGALTNIGGGGGVNNPVRMRFATAGGEELELKSIDFFRRQERIHDALRVDGFLTFQLGIAGQPDPRQIARLIALDELAREAGIEVTDDDLRSHLSETLEFSRATPQDFKNAVASLGKDQQTVEESIRMLLRVARFIQLVGFAGAVPDPERVVELWNQENQEFAFDYVALPVEELRDEAAAAVPDEAGLRAWFDGLSAEEKRAFETAEKRTAELALFRDAETTPAAELLAAYPEPVAEGVEPTAPEDLALQYYNRVFPRRFAKPASEDPENPAGFFTFDEVKDAALAEAPVYFAMQRWLADLNTRRTNGETIDLAAETARLGLDHQAFLEPLTREGYIETPELGADVANAVFATVADGSFYSSPIALASGLVAVRVNERTQPELPAFEEIQEQVREKWIEERMPALALERLEALRAGLEEFEHAPPEADPEQAPQAPRKSRRATAEAFRAAAEAAGLAVQTRDYLNRAGPATKDPLWEDAHHRALFAQAQSLGLYSLDTDEVAEPALSTDQETALLVRLGGKRDVPIANMSPTQYDRYKQQSRGRRMAEIAQGLDYEFLKANYGLWLLDDEREAAASGDDATE
jgi:parvulin-like peptidyl-prolyl isomerase